MNTSSVLAIFKEITAIPRESGHEGPITAYLCDWAVRHGLAVSTDEIQNVIITREAAPGKEDVPTIVLQAHQDMVCEKLPGVRHDFSKDPIRYEIEDGWMIAKETTLGADDGIGIAACLALLESDLPTGKIECVFTISEETGMDGAENMKEGFFSGKTLINLDSEDEGQLFIGCAGGENTMAKFSYSTQAVDPSWTTIELRIEGALGGHSGDDINKKRLNTVQCLASFLETELANGLMLKLLSGGGKSNAIARDCHAIIAVPDAQACISRFEAFAASVKDEYKGYEDGLVFSSKRSNSNEKAVDSDTTSSLIHALVSCPHGVVSMCKDIPGLVQTSTNLASVKMQEQGFITVSTSQRSSVESELDEIVARVSAVFTGHNAAVRSFNRYPGWEPDVNSHILEICTESYRRLFNTEPEIKAIHAGLECGLFLRKFPGLDMISFGPTLRGVHAPGERLDLASMDKFVELLKDVVCNFK